MPTDERPQAAPEKPAMEIECASGLFGGLLGRLTSVQAASDATVLTLTVAALLPVIQASMSFVGATTAAHQRAVAASAGQEAQNLAISAQAANKILESPPRTSHVAAAAVRNLPEPLAVS